MVKCADRNIHVIDDSNILRRLVVKLLTTEGFVCGETPDANEALALLRETPDEYDCILLDYMMPGMDGLTFLQCVDAEQLFPMMKIIMVSASSDTLKPYKKKYGFADIIAKPFDRGVLISAVRRACQQPVSAPSESSSVRLH